MADTLHIGRFISGFWPSDLDILVNIGRYSPISADTWPYHHFCSLKPYDPMAALPNIWKKKLNFLIFFLLVLPILLLVIHNCPPKWKSCVLLRSFSDWVQWIITNTWPVVLCGLSSTTLWVLFSISCVTTTCDNSGTIMTISKDRVKPSPLPDSWKLAEIFTTGIILGSYLAMMTVIFFWAAYKTDFFPVSRPSLPIGLWTFWNYLLFSRFCYLGMEKEPYAILHL